MIHFCPVKRFSHHGLLPLLAHFHSNNTRPPSSNLNHALKEIEQLHSIKLLDDEEELAGGGRGCLPTQGPASRPPPSIEICHPWPEWVNLVELLVKRAYLSGDGGDIGPKDTNRIRTACLNFARKRIDLMRYFSRKDIHLIAGCGCPSLDRKVVNSCKRLRAYVGIEEGTVCSSCILRGDCERAYVRAREDEVGRTVDVMRFLLTYGLDPITSSIENKLCLGKTVKASVRSLIKQMVDLGADEPNVEHLKVNSRRILSKDENRKIEVPKKQGDWNCPKCNFLNFARNVKCLRCNGLLQERLQKLGENQDYLPLKKGDWLCEKCNFLNFAKNTKCLQCKEKASNRKLNPGEWECLSCNYVNFRRNMFCLKCNWGRPKACNSLEASDQYRQKDQNLHLLQRTEFVSDKFDSIKSSKEDADFWLENDTDHSDNSGWSDDEDFPVLGGKSAISRTPHQREKWKLKMSKKMRDDGIELDEDNDNDGLNYGNFKGGLPLDGSSDHDEMAGWFGLGKRKQ